MKFTGVLVMFLAMSVGSTQPLPYSQNQKMIQLGQFVENQLFPVLRMVMEGKLPYPEINKRVKEQDRLIKRRFSINRININLRWSLSPVHSRVNAASAILPTGAPSIILYTSALMESYEGNQAYLIRVIMHERDHLTEMVKNATSVSVEDEAHFHALTTEFVTAPMKEKYGITLHHNDLHHYNAWISAGRSGKSLLWQSYIQKLLAPILEVK